MHVAGYKLTRRLASGTSGTVYAAESRSPLDPAALAARTGGTAPTGPAAPFASPSPAPASPPPGRRVAVKLVPAARVSPAVLREVRHLSSLSHPCILTLHRVARVPAPPPAPAALALVTELLPAGDLFDAVAAAEGRLHPAFARAVLRDVARGLLYLKRRRLVHADIKLENVGLVVSPAEWHTGGTGGAGDGVVAKILDFGTSRPPATFDSAHDNARPIGTALYLAPELLRAGSRRAAPSYATDAWALGVLLYSMLCGWYPFEPEATTDDEAAAASAASADLPSTEATAFAADYARDAILELPPRPLPARVPADLRAIVLGLLRKDPRVRMTVHEVVALTDGGNAPGEARRGAGVSAAARPPRQQGGRASAAVVIPGAAAAAPCRRRERAPLSLADPVFDSSSVADSDEALDDDDDPGADEADEAEGGRTDDGEGEDEGEEEAGYVPPARSQTVDDMLSIVMQIQRQLSEPNLLCGSPARARASS